MNTRSNYGRLRTQQGPTAQNAKRATSALALIRVLMAGVPNSVAWAQDAIADRYRAIRTPVESLLHRIDRQRHQAAVNALTRERRRVQSRLRRVERLALMEPGFGLAAAERGLGGQLGRLTIDLREARARLSNSFRIRRDGPRDLILPLTDGDPERFALRTEVDPFETRSAADSIEEARAFVENLLRAHQARQP